MKVVQINAISGRGSTGKICEAIGEKLSEKGIENYILYSLGESQYPGAIKCGREKEIYFQTVKSHLFGNYGFNSYCETKRILLELEKINPDLVHLHNIHGHDCNLKMLFDYLRRKKMKVVWTFHDCWAFTAYCTYFSFVGCEKWIKGCNCCPQRKEYSCFFDRSKKLYQQKKKLFCGVGLTIVTPSNWLANLIQQSYLKECRVKVINNGIDLNVFQPTTSDFRRRYEITSDRKIVLGIAFDWEIRKGLDVFIELSEQLPFELYQIVLVGTDDVIDRKLSNNIISIHRTKNQLELAEIYSAADVFVNPTREDNYPTVNMEALACGTPVLTFRTGGSPEMVDENCGSIVDCDDVEMLRNEIIRICEKKPYSKEACVNKAKEFDQNERFKEYLNLYEEIVTE